jgi:hypothetical protein
VRERVGRLDHLRTNSNPTDVKSNATRKDDVLGLEDGGNEQKDNYGL